MKTLLLLRHAKSSRDDPRLSDFDRPLNDRGKDDAKLVGRYLGKQEIKIDVIVSSPARRARRTAERVLEAAGLANQLVSDERIYEASVAQLLKVISEIEVTAGVALLIGHNPGFEDLLTRLTDRAGSMATASLACISLDVTEWRDVAPRCGELRWFITPKDLKT